MYLLISRVASKTMSGRLMGEVLKMLFSLPMLFYQGFSALAQSNTYGSAKWMSWWELRKILNAGNNGFCIGDKAISAKESHSHGIVIAPSGAGKTTTLIIPSIMNLSKHNKSMIVTDPSGEIVDIVGKALKNRGYEVRVINPNEPASSFKFNPLLRIRNDSDIHKVAQIIMSSSMGGKEHDPFWTNSGIHLLGILMRILLKEDETKRTLLELQQMVEKIGSSSRKQIDVLAAKHLSESHFESYLSIAQQAAEAPKTFLSVVANARSALSSLHGNVAQLTAMDTVQFEDLRTKKVAIFLCIPEHESKHYEFLSNIFYLQVFDFCAQMQKPKAEYRDIFLLLDEFANITIPNMTEIITTIRKRNVGCLLVIQSISQLLSKYQRDADVILGNTKTKFILSGVDITSARYIKDMIGNTTVAQRDNPFNIFGKSHEISRELIQAAEIRGLPQDSALFLFGNHQPARLRKVVPYYKNRKILALLK